MEPLHVVTAITNPCRYRSRYRLYADFEKYARDSGAILHTVEAAFGERPHAVTSSGPVIQLRTDHEIWHKENLLNIGIGRLPSNWKYVAWVDADVVFTRPDWVVETVHQLQHYSVVQMWATAQDMGPNYEPMHTHTGYMYSYVHGLPLARGYYGGGHPGFAWAARREAIDHLGGLIDIAVLGSADRHMAAGLVGQMETTVHPQLTAEYANHLFRWEDRAERHIKRNVGYVPGHLLHHWHGKKTDRQYDTRWNILIENQFDPDVDLKRDWQGVWQLTDQKPKLRDDIRRYFRARNEDSIDV